MLLLTSLILRSFGREPMHAASHWAGRAIAPLLDQGTSGSAAWAALVAEAGVTSGAVGVTVVVEDDVIMNDVIMICGPPFVEYDVARYNER